jgi:hypothetical protein
MILPLEAHLCIYSSIKLDVASIALFSCQNVSRVALKREAKRRNAKLLKRETVVRNGPKNFRDRFAV